MLNLSRKGLVVADLACGPGFFTIPIFEKLVKGGTLYSVDRDRVMLKHLRRNSESQSLEVRNQDKKLILLERYISDTAIAPYSVDAVLFANVLHDIDDKKAFLDEVKRVAKPEAKIVGVDWHAKETGGLGPPLERRLSGGRFARNTQGKWARNRKGVLCLAVSLWFCARSQWLSLPAAVAVVIAKAPGVRFELTRPLRSQAL